MNGQSRETGNIGYTRRRKTIKNTIYVGHHYEQQMDNITIRVITKLPNSEQSYKGKVKTHKYINRQNQSTTGKL
jgi:hypothetical protein